MPISALKNALKNWIKKTAFSDLEAIKLKCKRYVNVYA
jgi:hypothetical protein